MENWYSCIEYGLDNFDIARVCGKLTGVQHAASAYYSLHKTDAVHMTLVAQCYTMADIDAVSAQLIQLGAEYYRKSGFDNAKTDSGHCAEFVMVNFECASVGNTLEIVKNVEQHFGKTDAFICKNNLEPLVEKFYGHSEPDWFVACPPVLEHYFAKHMFVR